MEVTHLSAPRHAARISCFDFLHPKQTYPSRFSLLARLTQYFLLSLGVAQKAKVFHVTPALKETLSQRLIPPALQTPLHIVGHFT